MTFRFTLEQVEYASGHLLDEFGGEVYLRRRPSESDPQFRGRIKTEAFAAAQPTLRDYFAAKAMAAFISAPKGKFVHSNEMDVTKDAYVIADAMLAERAK